MKPGFLNTRWLLIIAGLLWALPGHAQLTQAQAIQAANNALSSFAKFAVPGSMPMPQGGTPIGNVDTYSYQYSMPDSFDSYGRPVYTMTKPMAVNGYSAPIQPGTYPVSAVPENGNEWQVGGFGVQVTTGSSGPFIQVLMSPGQTQCMDQMTKTCAFGNSSVPAVAGDWIMAGPALEYAGGFMTNVYPGPGAYPPVMQMLICVHDAGGGMASVQFTPIIEQALLTNYPSIHQQGAFEVPGTYIASFTVPTVPVDSNPPTGTVASPSYVRAESQVLVSYQVVPGS